MSYQKHNFTPGAVLLASQLNDMDNEIETLSQGGSGGTVLSDDFKEALLNCFENVAWINENGQTYYDALYDSLYSDNMWFITNVLTGCATSNNATSILKNNSYVATITANEGYSLDGATVSITMGENDVTNLYYSSGSINIPNVTGDLVITVSAVSNVSYITATFDQGEDIIYDTDSLDVLNQYLTVRAFYDNSESIILDYTEYELSGTLTVGTSTITVSYQDKTTTFSVVVTARAELASISAVFTQGSTTIYDTDSLDTLKQYLVVTATYSDSTTATVTDYTLSGTLTAGTSTITVSFNDKTTTFTVIVTHYADSRTLVYYWDFTGVNPLVDKVEEKTATESGTVNYSATDGASFGTNASCIALGLNGSALTGCDVELEMGAMVSTASVSVHQRLLTANNQYGFVLRKDNRHWSIYGSKDGSNTWQDTGLAQNDIANKTVKLAVYSASDIDVYVDDNLMLENGAFQLSSNALRLGSTSNSSTITSIKSLKIYRRE